MNRFPPELLCDIFLKALPYPIHPEFYVDYRTSITVPLYVSHVCRSWRALSLSIGELWSYLCIHHSSISESKVEVFDTWLERTNGGLLNFLVGCDCYWERDPASHHRAEHIIVTMLSQQHRWGEVKLIWRGVNLSSGFPGLSMTNMPMLTSLSLDVQLPLRANISIAQSFRLRQLNLHLDDFDLVTGDKPLCCLRRPTHLFSCHGGRPGIHALQMCLNLLKVAPFLTELHCTFWHYNSSPPFRPTNEPFVQLPNLLALEIDTCGIDNGLVLLDYVTVPNLRSLILSNDSYTRETRGLMFMNFFRRSLPPLITLMVLGHGVHEDFLIPILLLLPTLKYLRLSGAMISRRFFRELTVMSNDSEDSLFEYRQTCVCPALETLFLHRLQFMEDSDPCLALIAMLKSRAKITGRFRTIHFVSERVLVYPPIVAKMNLSVAEEDIGGTRRQLRHFLVEGGVLVGDCSVYESLLVRGL